MAQFTGKEGLSTLYEFDILLATARRQRMDLDAVQTGRARLTMHRPGKEDLAWNGMVRDIELLERNHGLTFCRVTLVPRAWWLTQIRTTQKFLATDLRGMLEAILRQAGLQPGLDQEFRLCETYSQREWTCQYAETHWNFFSRHMERVGLYCFFEQGEEREKLVVTDTFLSHTELPGGHTLRYRPSSGLHDPDKPVIAGAVPNQVQKMVVNQDNHTQCRLTTAGGNLLHVEDMEGSQRFLIQSPVRNSWLRIGAPNDPPASVDWDWSSLPTKEGIALGTGGS